MIYVLLGSFLFVFRGKANEKVFGKEKMDIMWGEFR